MTLSGQRVVIVGGTSGMGLATVRAAVGQGAEVIAAGRRALAGREAIEGVRQAEVDVTDEASVRALFDGVGTLDHLFVSASPGSPGPFLEQDVAAARTFMDGKLLGSWACARYAAPRMSRPQLHRGDIVQAPWPNISIAAIDPADIAAVAATVLTEPGHDGAAHTLSDPEPLTPADQIETLARVLARPLRYEPLSDDQARARMAADTPAPFIDAFFRFYSDGEFDDSPVLDTVQQITGHPPRRFEQWARAHADAFK